MRAKALTLSAVFLLAGMVPALACQEARMLYDDSFEEEDTVWNYDGDTVKLENEKLILAPKSGNYNVTTRLNQIDFFDDVDLCVTMTIAKAPDAGYARGGLVFWGQDYSNYYLLQVSVDGYFVVQRLSRNRWLTPVDWTKSAKIKTGAGAANDLHVKLVGKKGKIFINGEEVASFQGRPPRNGSLVGLVGVSPVKGAERTVLAFDDFQVSEPTGSDVVRPSASAVEAPASAAPSAGPRTPGAAQQSAPARKK